MQGVIMRKAGKISTAKDKPEPAQSSATRLPASAGNNIRNWRLFRNIPSQEALSEATRAADPTGAGITRAVINRLESGEYRWNEDHIRVLSLTLQCSQRDLIGTNPFDAGDIFAVYAGLSEADKRRAHRLVSKLKR